jgi:hypothetical protein
MSFILVKLTFFSCAIIARSLHPRSILTGCHVVDALRPDSSRMTHQPELGRRVVNLPGNA